MATPVPASTPAAGQTRKSLLGSFKDVDPHSWITISFFESRYALGVLFMSFLLDRIQHVVAPVARLQNATHLRADEPATAASGGGIRRIARKAMSYLVPLNFSRTQTRFFLRLPTLFLMYRSLILVLVLLGQGGAESGGPLVPTALGERTMKMEMKEVTFKAFIAVCCTLAMTAFNNGLDGGGSGHTALTFNLFEFAMTLHSVSSPVIHTLKPVGRPSRPDVHALLAMLAPITDLTIYHTIGISKQWSRHRLFSTVIAFFIILGSHLWNFQTGTSSFHINHGRSMVVLDGAILVVILVTWSLKFVTEILLEGTISNPLRRLPANMTLRWEDDFRTVLLKLLMASFSTTSISGFANEMPVLVAGSGESAVEILPNGQVFVDVSPGAGGIGGLGREIKKVKAHTPQTSDAILGGLMETKRIELISTIINSYRAVVTTSAHRILLKLPPVPLFSWVWWRRQGLFTAAPVVEKQGATCDDPAQETEDALYQGFLRGVSITSDGDSDYSPENDGREDPDDGYDADLANEDVDDDDTEPESSLSLFEPVDTSSAPILLTHLLDNSASPLTRRRYQHMSTSTALSTSIESPPRQVTTRRQNTGTEEEKQTCIVCYCEPRAVVCWPCRCLCICDDCRSSLASLPLNQHLCPTCRTPVEGYSRIFMP